MLLFALGCRVFGQTFSMFKEKSGAALEAAKSSNAGKTIAGGLSNAATASQEKYGKLKGTDAFKKSSTLASDAYERTSLVASGALEKVGVASSVARVCVCTWQHRKLCVCCGNWG